MIYFHLPGLFEYFDLYKFFINIFKCESNKFRDVKIGSIYGAPAGCLWNGGRTGYAFGATDASEVAQWCLQEHISGNLVFTNCLLEKEHFLDAECNNLLDLFHNENNGITIFSEELKEYIITNYPLYHFTSSTTKCLTELNEIIEELQKYDLVVLDYNFNNSPSLLQIQDKAKCEILVNSVCDPGCTKRYQHYIEISEFGLGLRTEHLYYCSCQSKNLWEILDNKTVLKIEDIYRYEKMGFSHFKIEGRTTSYTDLIEILVYYMVKPEYQLEMRQRLAKFFQEIMI